MDCYVEQHYINEDDIDYNKIDDYAFKCKNLKNSILY